MLLHDKRIAAINSTMNNLYDQLAVLYESLADEHYSDAEKAIESVRVELKFLKDSIRNETKR